MISRTRLSRGLFNTTTTLVAQQYQRGTGGDGRSNTNQWFAPGQAGALRTVKYRKTKQNKNSFKATHNGYANVMFDLIVNS